jgi:AcrR family transcriptional regulator
MPRTYRLGERETQMRTTRERIVEAAIELCIEVGISKATMRQVGLRADVAPGTLRNHFPSRMALEEAMVERLTAEGPLPDASIFDGADSLEERVGRLLHVTATFFEQAGRLYRMWLREPMLASPWSEAGARYGARWAELERMALGPLADDEDVQAVLRAVMAPPFFDALRGGARSTPEASALITAAIVPWLRARADEASTDGLRGHAGPRPGTTRHPPAIRA